MFPEDVFQTFLNTISCHFVPSKGNVENFPNGRVSKIEAVPNVPRQISKQVFPIKLLSGIEVEQSRFGRLESIGVHQVLGRRPGLFLGDSGNPVVEKGIGNGQRIQTNVLDGMIRVHQPSNDFLDSSQDDLIPRHGNVYGYWQRVVVVVVGKWIRLTNGSNKARQWSIHFFHGGYQSRRYKLSSHGRSKRKDGEWLLVLQRFGNFLQDGCDHAGILLFPTGALTGEACHGEVEFLNGNPNNGHFFRQSLAFGTDSRCRRKEVCVFVVAPVSDKEESLGWGLERRLHQHIQSSDRLALERGGPGVNDAITPLLLLFRVN